MPVVSQHTAGRHDRGVEATLLYAAYARKPLNILMTSVVALVGGAIAATRLPTTPMLVWMGTLLATQAVGFWECRAFKRAQPAGAELRQWQRYFLLQSAASGLAWASGPVLMLRPDSGVELAFFVGTLLSVSAVGMTSVAEQRASMYAFIACQLAPTAAAAAAVGRDSERLVALALLVGMTLMIAVGRNLSITMRSVLEGRERIQSILDLATDAVVSLDRHARIVEANDRAAQVFGWAPRELIGASFRSRLVAAESAQVFDAAAKTAASGVGEPRDRVEILCVHQNGAPFAAELALARLDSGALIAFVSDISERKRVQEILLKQRAEEEKAKLEAQLMQAQKMESVGRLAGGVAHDFNNMLSVILGYADSALSKTDDGQAVRDELLEIRDAAQRSAGLTRQLLAFARKQTVEPKVLDLSVAVQGTLSLMRRLVGSSITVSWTAEQDLWPVRIDPSQLDQVLTNLCVNARDAIDGVGHIHIDATNFKADAAFCAGRPDAAPGDYVRLRVSDDGRGMSAQSLALVFEPFFTTKAVGQGTGLGLATVYGAVIQNGGFITASSQEGVRTEFAIHLPRHAAPPATDALPREPEAHPQGGKETILVVEDEPPLLRLTVRILNRLGYQVISASTPSDAIRVAAEHAQIHLLLTDVIMPEMNGWQLARLLSAQRPNLRCLFMSGYTADAVAHDGILDPGVSLIEKPFDGESLAARVRSALDA